MRRPVMGRGVARQIALAVAGAVVFVAIGGPIAASALTALPERATYVEAGTLYTRLPFGSEGSVLVAPTLVPGGSAGLEPPVEIAAYSWTADGASLAILVQGTTSGLYREFSYDQQTRSLSAVSEPSAARPSTFNDKSAVDPPADAPAKWPDGGAVGATIRLDGDPPTPQVFVIPEGGTPVRVGPEEVRGRVCSHVSISPGGRYVVYDVAKPDGGSEVWVSAADKRTDSFLMSANGSRGAWQPYYRPGNTGGGSGLSGTGRKVCSGPFGILGLAGAGAAGGAYRRRRR